MMRLGRGENVALQCVLMIIFRLRKKMLLCIPLYSAMERRIPIRNCRVPVRHPDISFIKYVQANFYNYYSCIEELAK